jgi:hypothetical protein
MALKRVTPAVTHRRPRDAAMLRCVRWQLQRHLLGKGGRFVTVMRRTHVGEEEILPRAGEGNRTKNSPI